MCSGLHNGVHARATQIGARARLEGLGSAAWQVSPCRMSHVREFALSPMSLEAMMQLPGPMPHHEITHVPHGG